MAPLARLSTPNNAHSMASLMQCLSQKKNTHTTIIQSAPMCFSTCVLNVNIADLANQHPCASACGCYVHVSGLITWVHACFFTSLAIERYRMQCSQSVALLRPHKHPHDVLQFYNHWLLSLCPRAPGWML